MKSKWTKMIAAGVLMLNSASVLASVVVAHGPNVGGPGPNNINPPPQHGGTLTPLFEDNGEPALGEEVVILERGQAKDGRSIKALSGGGALEELNGIEFIDKELDFEFDFEEKKVLPKGSGKGVPFKGKWKYAKGKGLKGAKISPDAWGMGMGGALAQSRKCGRVTTQVIESSRGSNGSGTTVRVTVVISCDGRQSVRVQIDSDGHGVPFGVATPRPSDNQTAPEPNLEHSNPKPVE